MTSVQTRADRADTGLVIDDTRGSVSIPTSRGGLPPEPAAWVTPEPAARISSGRRHLDKRRHRRTVTNRRAAQRAQFTRHSAPRHAASRHPAPAELAPAGGPSPAPVGGGSDRTARRMAAVLVVLTLCYGVAVGMLLSPRSGTAWNALRRIGLAPAMAGAPAHGDAARGVPSITPDGLTPQAPGPARAARGPGGPAPLPAEVAPLPVGLSIPAIGVDEPTLLPLGLNPDGTMQVPDDFARAGWFTGGPTPGTSGPAVIAGHVDSFRGPAVFFRLRELKAGDVVMVRLSNGSQARFVVDGVSLYSKDDFPTEAVFGPVPGVALRLITCGGSFDRLARSYRSNVVVYASQHEPAG